MAHAKILSSNPAWHCYMPFCVMMTELYSQLSRCCTARGSSTDLCLVGPAKVKNTPQTLWGWENTEIKYHEILLLLLFWDIWLANFLTNKNISWCLPIKDYVLFMHLITYLSIVRLFAYTLTSNKRLIGEFFHKQRNGVKLFRDQRYISLKSQI